MALVLVVAFIVVPIVELAVLGRVADAIGLPWTLALLLVSSVLGGWLVKREGTRAWQAVRTAVAEHRVPAREVADGALVIVGGALLLTPGFVTDAVGLLLVLPPSRALVRRTLSGLALARFGVVGRGAGRARSFSRRWPGARRAGVRRVPSRRGPGQPTPPGTVAPPAPIEPPDPGA